jgi:TRAP transporter TAXI family solute receptor
MQIGGAAVGQFGHFVATGWARTAAHAPGYRASAVATSGFVENLQLVAQRRMEFGFTAGLTFDQARAGDTAVISRDELAVMRGVFTLPAGSHHIVVLQSSPVRQLADLKGKRISGFGRGSLGWTYVANVLATVGVARNEYREQPLGPAQAMQALKDGTVDVVYGTGNPPIPAVVELGATTPFRLIPIPATSLTKLEETAPSWQSGLIPRGTYGSQPEADVPTIQQTQIAITHDGIPADTVYAMTWAVMEHLSEFGAVHPGAKLLTLATALNGMSVPLHPGALRYFRAKGVNVPARLIPPGAS